MPDLDDLGLSNNTYTTEDDLGYIKASEKVFEIIKQKVDSLIAKL